MNPTIARIRSGGQTGVDRAALDFARKHNMEICGWCPKGGWAEDYPEEPGILAVYPELQETPEAAGTVRDGVLDLSLTCRSTVILTPTAPTTLQEVTP